MCQERAAAETKIDRLIAAIELLCALLQSGAAPAGSASFGNQGQSRTEG